MQLVHRLMQINICPPRVSQPVNSKVASLRTETLFDEVPRSLPDSNNILTFPLKIFQDQTQFGTEGTRDWTTGVPASPQNSEQMSRMWRLRHPSDILFSKRDVVNGQSDTNLTKKLMPTLACFWRQAALVWHLRCYSKRLAVFFMLHRDRMHHVIHLLVSTTSTTATSPQPQALCEILTMGQVVKKSSGTSGTEPTGTKFDCPNDQMDCDGPWPLAH